MKLALVANENSLMRCVLVLCLAACVPIEEGAQQAALVQTPQEVESSEDAALVDGFDFEAEVRPTEELALVGKPLTGEALQQEDAAEDDVVEPIEVAAAPLEAPATADNSFALTEGEAGGQHVQSWGLRVVATIPQAQPPRAILELPGGGEVVVVPGTLLPESGVVVLAIGERLVKIAEVTPQGDHAELTSRELHTMY